MFYPERSRVHTERSRGGELYTVDSRLGFARRAIAPGVLYTLVSASLDEQSPNRATSGEEESHPALRAPLVRGEYTIAPEGRHHNKSK